MTARTSLKLLLHRSMSSWRVVVVVALAFAFGATLPSAAAAQDCGTPFTTIWRHDLASRLVGTIRSDADGAGPRGFAATRYSYNAQGLLSTVETGELSQCQPSSVHPAVWLGFTVLHTTTHTYDNWGRRLTTRTSAPSTSDSLTQFSYDAVGRLVCTAVRMNPGAYASLPASACDLGSGGTHGADRITRTSYDSLSRPTQIQRAVGTADQIDYATYTYSDPSGPGVQTSVTDANGNKTLYDYDALKRQTFWYFPSKTTPGSHSTTDYEQYGYDRNGNRTSLRKRDGRWITFTYDALNRVRQEIYPSGTLPTHFNGYDLRNLRTYTRLGSDTAGADGVSNAYDGFGRVFSATTQQAGRTRTLAYEYNVEGQRTRLTFPDGQFATFSYDDQNRMVAVFENGDANPVLAFTYDALGRRSNLSRAGGVSSTAYVYEGMKGLKTLTQDLPGSAYDEVRSFTRNPADQVVTRNLSNGIYSFTEVPSATTNYTVNGLNQYTLLSGATSAAPQHDANGNMTSDGSSSYSYDILNRLTGASGARNGSLTYDAKGRLFQSDSVGTGTTQFLYDGDALVAEYDGAGFLKRRYLHGPGVDEPLLAYHGSALNATTRRYLHADHQGSVMASLDTAGTTQVNTFDPYGVPASTNATRFQYTGQIWLPELGLYHYKARAYNPRLGRFMQTDPVGYKDDLDLYTYVGDDPVNNTDPTGMTREEDRCQVNFCGIGVSGPHPRFEVSRSPEEQAVAPTVTSTMSQSELVGGLALTAGVALAPQVAIPMIVRRFAVGVPGAAAKGVLPAAAAKIDPVKIREIESIVRSGGTHFPLDTGAQLRAVAESFAGKVRGAASPEAAAHIRDVGLGAIDRLDRFKALTPEAVQQLRDIVNGAFRP